jgi:hypothetical protein
MECNEFQFEFLNIHISHLTQLAIMIMIFKWSSHKHIYLFLEFHSTWEDALFYSLIWECVLKIKMLDMLKFGDVSEPL